MARSKPKTMVIADAKQAEAAMLELAKVGRMKKAAELEAQEGIDEIKANTAAFMKPLQARMKELEGALCTYATLNKGELFSKRKSRETPYGVYGWRKATKLLTIGKIKLSDVLERLRQLNLKEAIRVKESVDKPAMADWPDSRLETVGIQRVSKDEFYIEINEESVGGEE